MGRRQCSPHLLSSMIYGITGNARKDKLWHPVAELIQWLQRETLPFYVHPSLVRGLVARGLLEARHDAPVCEDLAREADVVLSFGGDGTMLRTAHSTGINDTPLLGVNIGRLGFLADIEVGAVRRAIRLMEAGDYRVERRMVLEATLPDESTPAEPRWALNEFVIDRSGASGMIKVEAIVDGTPLNTYWADGLIVATPTGSTAYSLSTGGPIIAPGCDAIILTPIAPHTLTVRPIVLPSSSDIRLRVLENTESYVFAADGQSTVYDQHDVAFNIYRASHTVNLIKLPDQHYFKTLRSKLMWGAVSHLDDGSSPADATASLNEGGRSAA